MLKALALLAVFAACATATKLSPFGIVEGIKDCGSMGRLGTVSVTDCNKVPCFFNPSDVYDVAIRFTASVTSSTLRLQIHEFESGALLLEYPINGEIQAGVEYELTFALPINPEWSGAEFDIVFYILDFEGIVIEVCAQAPIVIR